MASSARRPDSPERRRPRSGHSAPVRDGLLTGRRVVLYPRRPQESRAEEAARAKSADARHDPSPSCRGPSADSSAALALVGRGRRGRRQCRHGDLALAPGRDETHRIAGQIGLILAARPRGAVRARRHGHAGRPRAAPTTDALASSPPAPPPAPETPDRPVAAPPIPPRSEGLRRPELGRLRKRSRDQVRDWPARAPGRGKPDQPRSNQKNPTPAAAPVPPASLPPADKPVPAPRPPAAPAAPERAAPSPPAVAAIPPASQAKPAERTPGSSGTTPLATPPATSPATPQATPPADTSSGAGHAGEIEAADGGLLGRSSRATGLHQ